VVYSSESENRYRESVFLNNLKKIESHNSKNDETYTMALNQFSAMSQE